MTRLAILGATGSIGRQALDVVRSQPDRLRVTAIASARNAPELEAIATQTGASTVVLQERDGDDALCDLATRADVDLVLVATPGIAGLAPTLAALGAGKRVALANKEVLVTGGHLVAALAGGAGDRLRPVDSEHCGLWQCLIGERMASVSRVAVTASGGPFRERPLADLGSVTPDEALRHPTWKMGP
ncbi:MAG TPA: Gfo/Idh/MocA family oxidoreductase, partial [Candidatus Limnocylindria bacterium]|nr:Gfo/Idh/MocA family oxidoreductase [Candidatus Limnocylindria bacterium]